MQTALSAKWLPFISIVLLGSELSARADVAPPPFTSLQPVRASGLRSTYMKNWRGEVPKPVNFCLRSVRTSGLSWVTAGTPVTYSFTIGDLTGGSAFVRLVGGSMPVLLADRSVAANVICLQVDRLADGTASACLRFKMNSTNTEPPVISTLASPRAEGTWRLILDGTNATIQASDGRTQSATLDLAALHQFADPMSVYFGGGQGEPYDSLDLTLCRVSITGVADPLEETFEGKGLDSARWEFSGGASVVVPKEARMWLTSPALYFPGNYTLQTTTSLQGAAWSDYLVPTNSLLPYGRYMAMTAIPFDTNVARFFRTISPYDYR